MMDVHAMDIKYYTLVFLTQQDKVLLGYKKAGFSQGLWNGFGGKLENEENGEQCAIRELKEECGLTVDKHQLHYLGIVESIEGSLRRVVYIYTSDSFSGTLEESDEMRPQWFHVDQVPYEQMLPDSVFWLNLVFEKCFMLCSFVYTNDGKLQQPMKIEVLTTPPKPQTIS